MYVCMYVCMCLTNIYLYSYIHISVCILPLASHEAPSLCSLPPELLFRCSKLSVCRLNAQQAEACSKPFRAHATNWHNWLMDLLAAIQTAHKSYAFHKDSMSKWKQHMNIRKYNQANMSVEETWIDMNRLYSPPQNTGTIQAKLRSWIASLGTAVCRHKANAPKLPTLRYHTVCTNLDGRISRTFLGCGRGITHITPFLIV